MTAYLSLFFSALIAATLLPMGSEALLLYHADQSGLPWFFLWLSATCGNVLGSVVNYGLGYWAAAYIEQKYENNRNWQRASSGFRRYGSWSLLFAWLPLIGDPLTLLAGIARIRFSLFLILVAAGKGARYAILLLLVN